VKDKVFPECGMDLNAQAILVERFRGECCENELVRLSSIIAQKHVDVLVGMGGGKTIDTAKIVADRAGIPVIIVPLSLRPMRRAAGARCCTQRKAFSNPPAIRERTRR